MVTFSGFSLRTKTIPIKYLCATAATFLLVAPGEVPLRRGRNFSTPLYLCCRLPTSSISLACNPGTGQCVRFYHSTPWTTYILPRPQNSNLGLVFNCPFIDGLFWSTASRNDGLHSLHVLLVLFFLTSSSESSFNFNLEGIMLLPPFTTHKGSN